MCWKKLKPNVMNHYRNAKIPKFITNGSYMLLRFTDMPLVFGTHCIVCSYLAHAH